jgi:two-component system sensor histidine kinase and response regulator WspE
MLDLFRGEVEGQATSMNSSLLALERGAEAAPLLELLMRGAHSIKGAARIVGLEQAVQISHVMEDVFVAAQKGEVTLDATAIDTLLSGLDLLLHLAQNAERDLDGWLAREEARLTAAMAGMQSILRATAPQTTPDQAKPAQDLSSFSLHDLFKLEAEQNVVELQKALREIAAVEGEAAERSMRAAHSLKGAARIIGMNALVGVSDALERYFEAIMKHELVPAAEDAAVLQRGVSILERAGSSDEASFTNWASGAAAEIDSTVTDINALRTTRPAAAERQARKPAAGKKPAASEPAASEKPAPPVETPAAAEKEPAAKEPAAPAKASAPSSKRDVRITPEHLNRLLALAGESVVQVRWLQTFEETLHRIRNLQSDLADALHRLEENEAFSDDAALIREIAERAGDNAAMFSRSVSDLETYSRRAENLSSRLYQQVIATRMRPFSDGVGAFPRFVRDIARELGKKAHLEIDGVSTDVDRDILEKLEAPLNHLLRNAIDHGLETPAERLAAGKREEGTIRLEAGPRGGMLFITVTDDGRGVNIEKLRERVVERKLATPEMVTKLSQAELLEFLFLPGFTTTNAITHLSGRGVGLDVVQSMVQEVGGVVRISSTEGAGTTFFIQLPITRSVLRTLLVEINGEPFAIPLPRIERVLSVGNSDILLVENRQFVQFDGNNIGLISAHQVLELGEYKSENETVFIVILSDQLARYGIVVDRFLGEQDLVVRPIDAKLGKIPQIQAVSLMRDGSPVFIIDVDDMLRSIDNVLSGGRLRKLMSGGAEVHRARKKILVVDDSITVREVERKLLENSGYEVDVAVDGMDGWNAVRSGNYDLVISDVDMPRMTGIELVTNIKNDARTKSIPVVIVSYKDREEDRLRGLEAGANYYLTKSSFHDQTMINAVVDLIGGPGA